ncbi:phage tail sheath subtilisin-like domain-containing protein, partial [Algibacter sp.]|nr:phage tail sheath subtilisin-like domain-containing protein [Algibacter sp.]
MSNNNVLNSNQNLHSGLLVTSMTYTAIIDGICTLKNRMPPSGAMAGIYTSVDNNRGVWKAPANISINHVIKPTVEISNAEQALLNVDAVSGKSINAIRSFPGKGILVWGARTLDGNSSDHRYISVQRTIMMLEQSIKLGLEPFVFEPNDANTWAVVKVLISNYLNTIWRDGALAGAKTSDAFFVSVGLGSTMTAQDILEGKMIISIGVAPLRPAEFIILRLSINMEE